MIATLSDLPQVHMPQSVGEISSVLPENELIKDLKGGNSLPLYKLYEMYAPSLLGIITKIIKYDDIAEDLLQETFVKIWKSIDQFDPDKGKLFTWMSRVARNTSIDYLRGQACAKNLRTTDLDLSTIQIEKNNSVNYNIDTIGIKELINVLPQSQKQILDLVYFQGYTQVEVSDRLQIPLGSVKSKIRYAIVLLRDHFK